MKFRLFPSIFSIRRKNRIEADLAIREERAVGKTFLPVLIPAFTGYAAVDWIAAGFTGFWTYFFIRTVTVVFAVVFYWATRNRLGHSLRFLLVPAIPTFVIQLIMISNMVYFSPYFAGLGLILFQATVYSPKKPAWIATVFSLACLPTFIVFILQLQTNFMNAAIGLTMLIGTIVTCLQHTSQFRSYLLEAVKSRRQLAQDLTSREREIREKAAELMKRKRFESQFSPQVVARVLNNISNYEKLNTESICTIVFDIKDSSSKSDSLNPMAYAEVIEEVFDLIAAACLKWNITIDKFTGDGAQAFAGSPEKRPDDLKRCVEACGEILRMLQARQDYLSMRWQGRVELKFGICEGTALVGFLGKGAMRSFTAIGNNVSLTHRICGESKAGNILVHCAPSQEEQFSVGSFNKKKLTLKNLKGFEDKSFQVLELSPRFIQSEIKDIGRCENCSTPLVLVEDNRGIPKVTCPACSSQTEEKNKSLNRPS